jgi:hypothetical protein
VARRFASNCVVLAGPMTARPAHSCASTAATATASGPVPWAAATSRTTAGASTASLPLARVSLTSTRFPAACAAASARPADGSSRFHVDWTAENTACPATSSANARSIAAACAGPDVEKPTATPFAASSASASSNGSSVNNGLSTVSEWTWYSCTRSPSSARVSAHCAANRAAECSFTSCTSASSRQSPTYA